MPEPLTADAKLLQVLTVIPLAGRSRGGIPVAELAARVGGTPEEILANLQEVLDREFYHPAGSTPDISVDITAEQVSVRTSAEYRRPPKLSQDEVLALGIGLRMLASDAPPDRQARFLELAARLEAALCREPPAGADRVAIEPAVFQSGGRIALLTDAARLRRRCRIVYAAPEGGEPTDRRIDPYTLLTSEGRWYVVGHCHLRAAIRVFRVDRMLDAAPLEETFTVADGFDPAEYVTGGRVFRADEFLDVEVRFSAAIARWIEEKGPVERQADGSVIVRYSVADPAWIVGHVLAHGADAEVLAPPEIRARVREAALRMVGEDPAVTATVAT
jgi:proteasome accessory factor C